MVRIQRFHGRARVQFLARELRSHKPCCVAKKKKKRLLFTIAIRPQGLLSLKISGFISTWEGISSGLPAEPTTKTSVLGGEIGGVGRGRGARSPPWKEDPFN